MIWDDKLVLEPVVGWLFASQMSFYDWEMVFRVKKKDICKGEYFNDPKGIVWGSLEGFH